MIFLINHISYILHHKSYMASSSLNWREIPFVRILLPFLAGVLLALHIGLVVPYTWISLCCIIGILLVVNFIRIDYQYRWVFGFFLNIALFLFGNQITSSCDVRYKENFVGNQVIDSQQILIGQVSSPPTIGNKVKLHLRVKAIGTDSSNLQAASGYFLIYLPEDKASTALAYGDEIALKAWLSSVPPPSNPDAFDYQNYLAKQNIFHQAFVKEGNWAATGKNTGNSLLKKVYHLRTHLITTLREHLETENEFAVGAALILGHRSELSDEVTNAYSGTGAMHVLAVSGLHVGLVFLFLNFLFGLFLPKSLQRIIRPILLLLGIWLFALLTGGSASVLRAATMFSFLIVGQATRRKSSVYNTLASSAFLLLCLNPYLIANVGFQLSYAALFGIVYFQPKIYKLWLIDNYLGDKIWALTTVSIAAQLTTFPISLYYFHQFPTLFWLSGVAVVPLATIILPVGIALLALQSVPFLGFVLGKAMFWLLWFMNSYIFLLQSLPGSLIEGVWIGFGVVLLLYLAIFSFSIAFQFKKIRWIHLGLICLIFVAIQHIRNSIQRQEQVEITFYQVNKHTAVDFITGNKTIFLASDSIPEKSLFYAVKSHRERLGLESITCISPKDSLEDKHFFSNGRFIQFRDKRILLVNEPFTGQGKIAVDYVLLFGNPRIAVADILKYVDFKMLVLDPSNSFYSNRRWMEECGELSVECRNLRDGSLLVDLK